MNRTVTKTVQGFWTVDGGGVKLVRVLSNETVRDFDPFLMLDSFDSRNPEDYTKGFPMHPHRGIETISYLYKGTMVHSDTLGNKREVNDGEVQYMTAGSGILHEEQVPARNRLCGLQLWLNLPAKDKMCTPEYSGISSEQIEEIPLEGGVLRLLMGNFGEHHGVQGRHLPMDYYDIQMEPGAEIRIPTESDRSAMLFTLEGKVSVEGELIPEKTAAKLSEGDALVLRATDGPAHVLFMSSVRLNEPVAWGGPVVMNTEKELRQAFAEIRDETFIREKMKFD